MDATKALELTQDSVTCQQQLLDFLHRIPVPKSQQEQEEFDRLLANAAVAHSRWLSASPPVRIAAEQRNNQEERGG